MMTRYTRRALLASTGVVLAAGCSSDGTSDSGGSSDNDGTDQPDTPRTAEGEPDNTDSNANGELGQQDYSETIVDDTVTVAAGEYITWDFTLDTYTPLSLSATVQSGPDVDIVLSSPSAVRDFENGVYLWYTDLHLTETQGGNDTFRADPGDWVLFLDNTDAISAEPPENFDDGLARVEVLLEAQRTS